MLNRFNLANMLLDGASRSININPQRCVRIKHKNASCQSCEINCPVHAIEVGGPGMTITVDWDKCTGCGICTGVCPGQAFNLRNLGYKDFIDKCCKNIQSDGTFEIGCKDAEIVRGAGVASVECLGVLNMVDFMTLYLCGARKIHLKYGDCGDCASKNGEKILSDAVLKLQEFSGIFEDLNDLHVEKGRREILITFPKQLPIHRPTSEVKPNPIVGRRGLFSYLTNNLKETAFKSASLMAVQKLEERTVVTFDVFQTERRKAFLESIMSLGGLTCSTAPKGDYFNAIEISPLCVYCGMCVKFCGPKALTINKERTKIFFNASKCISCGLCERACYHGRLQYKDTVELKDFFSNVLLVDKNADTTTKGEE